MFDHEMFTTTQGMVKWNKEIFHENKDSIESRVNTLLDIKFDSTLQASLEGMKKLTGRTPKNIRLSIILAPVEGIGFGGMENDAFIFDLLGNNFDVINMVQEGIPHEFNHFIYEGRDILTDEKLFERNYTIPPAQKLEEVIGYYARQIAQNIKLPSQFDLLAPKVRDFFERKAFGEVVNLNDEKVIRAMSSNISSYVVIKEFEKALREIVIEHKEPQLPSPLLVFARRHIVQAHQQTSSSHSRTKK
ncbi:MAG: hypothetical protein SGI89_09075 [bacterium]|nr:hypothetical protein [bacterium]